MSKSYGNYIGINEPPQEIYGKVMSISDAMMWRYYELLTDASVKAIEEMKADVSAGRQHPMALKKALARRIVQDFHSAEAAQSAEENWSRQFQKDEVPEDVEVQTVYRKEVQTLISDIIRLDKLLLLAGLVTSASEGQRKLKEGAVYMNGEQQTHPTVALSGDATDFVLKLGKKIKRVRLEH
jgi:tyrosyl-tRNA synthetase